MTPHQALNTDAARNREIQEIEARQRKLSPIFPNVREAKERARQRRETVAGRVALGLSCLFAVGTPWAAYPLYCAGASVTCFGVFLWLALEAGSRHDRDRGATP